jgi:SAM-dependent methyltransferase
MPTEAFQTSLIRPPAMVGGYDPTWFEILSGVEDEHFWFRVRNQIIAAAATRLVNELGETPRLLEVGCGNGNVLRVLKELWPRSQAVGLDLFGEGLQLARRRCDCEIVQGDIRHASFPAASFNLIGVFDVLEHLPDEEDVLDILYALLAPGGVLLLTVPSCRSLWSYFDEVAGHCRRYGATQLADRLYGAGFEVDCLTHFMATIFPLLWVQRRFGSPVASGAEQSRRAIAEMKLPRTANEIMRRVLQWERWWIARGGRLPIGTSLLAMARKVQ